MLCRFEFYPVFIAGYTHTLAACRCVAEHGAVTASTLCPIGMIQQARDEAIEAIRAERNPQNNPEE